MSRHRWGPPVVVEVPWSAAAGGNLYTCVKCGTTRQTEPRGGYGVRVYYALDGSVRVGKTPPSQPVVSPQKA